MQSILAAVAALLFVSPGPTQERVESIRNFVWVEEDACTGGQPTLEQLTSLKEAGIRAVVNLRQPREYDETIERERLAELGLRYFNIPVEFMNPTEDQATEFLRLTDDPANRPVFIHCTAAIRAGAFWMIRRILRDGWSFERAEAEAVRIGLHHSPHLNEFVRSYVENHR